MKNKLQEHKQTLILINKELREKRKELRAEILKLNDDITKNNAMINRLDVDEFIKLREERI
tara:strand:- start:671 stop:853 length:183 start_codon:yes stop_codon:yes gene_type:complete